MATKKKAAKKSTKKPRTFTRLSDKEKAVVKKMTKEGATMRQIAKKLGRVPSTIWRWQQR